jgi:glycosyltransferase involved in cell wall biosynthesis
MLAAQHSFLSEIGKVDIIIPVFNRMEYLHSTLKGVIEQTYEKWELVVVDDGSEEDVAGFLKYYPDPRIQFIQQENSGNASARNAGIKRGNGEYCICLDSDDVWRADMLQTCVSYLEKHRQADVVHTQVQAIDSQGKPIARPIGPQPHNGDLLQSLLMGYPILPSSALFRRSCVDRWGPFVAGLDDWELWLRWAANGCHFGYVDQPLLLYRIHEQNFNLDYDRRRTAHFMMLDKFYSSDHLPAIAHQLRDRAYAKQHDYFSVLAWQLNRPDDGRAQFAHAVQLFPDYLQDIDFYTRIACAHQGRIEAGSAVNLNLDLAETTLLDCLAYLFSLAPAHAVLDKKQVAFGWAYLALARIAYSVAHDMPRARKWLQKALVAWPGIAWHSDWGAWVVRTAVSYRRVQELKAKLNVGIRHA